ncbi:MAG: glycosyltransferase family 4 protein [Phycisphaeraceae bacterium]|nr:glycosyltransferase family 4 protein [Phycisphaeraceae bacterium]
MRILVAAGMISWRPWADGPLVGAIVRSLASRGHEVHVAADSIDDDSILAGAAGVVAMRPLEDNPHRSAARFVRFVRSRRHEVSPRVMLSCSHLVGAEVWMPTDFSAWAWFASVRRQAGWLRIGMKMARHIGLPASLWCERSAGRSAGVGRALVSGPGAAADLMRSFPGLASRVVHVGTASLLEPSSAEEAGRIRSRMRTAMGIGPGVQIVLVSIPWPVVHDDPQLTNMLEGLRLLGDRGPRLVVLARDAVAVHTAACRADVDGSVQILGRAEDPTPLLLGADVALSPMVPHGGVFWAGSFGRFAADAVRLGRPVIAAPGTGAADVLGGVGMAGAGLVAGGTDARSWADALAHVGSDEWIGGATAAASGASDSLSLNRFVDRLEGVLNETAGIGRAEGGVPM